MRILAVDCGRNMGFAVDGPKAWTPILIAHRLPPTDDKKYGRMLRALANVVCVLVRAHEPELIAVEAAMPFGGKKGQSTQAARTLQIVRQGVVEMVAWDFRIPCEEKAVQSVRKHFIGEGRPRDPKYAVVKRCRLLGWDPPDDNTADAAALWDYMKSLYEPKFGAESTLLFRAGRAAG